jgi:hypothetical protein
MAGAPPDQRKRKAPAPAAAAEDEAEVEELESEVADLDRRTLEHLRRTAARLPDAAFSRLAPLRPPVRLGMPLFLPANLPCRASVSFETAPPSCVAWW